MLNYFQRLDEQLPEHIWAHHELTLLQFLNCFWSFDILLALCSCYPSLQNRVALLHAEFLTHLFPRLLSHPMDCNPPPSNSDPFLFEVCVLGEFACLSSYLTFSG